ncbi:hypothetical protein DPSP01_012998 [Paraphaeosphaeria sporulosa]|uniref:Uncharacterized protein n=1 Tax=Paraphaeosphaeria sporulosa TaxID=1460663 RepID=A0A177BVT4_9PLEO|nr:uncharacterized protein CC84DRAFT_1130423 [Paraphaeosphaeria sporulosa]OAF99603.1 hypothetical protein CC84DRAFT_1130423 [Paraphaeosphaeria sporulosa]
MGLFALEEWAQANADYNNDTPPYWHAKIVPDLFTAISGILWSVSYILMTLKGYKDRSYAMPIYCLCLNITWEFVFGFIYGPGLVNQIVFAQYMVVDVFLFHSILKFGPNEWRAHPLVARNLSWIIGVGCAVCLGLHLVLAKTFVPVIGRQVIFFTAWPMQHMISLGCVAQVLSRGHDAGQSMAIWWTRFLGTVTAGCCFYWRIYFWPERFGYAWTPYGALLLVGSHVLDLAFPFALAYVRKHGEGRQEKVNGKAA